MPAVVATPRILIYGNCQAEWLAKQLNQQPEIQSSYAVIYIAGHGTCTAKNQLVQPEFYTHFTHVFWQTAAGWAPPEFVRTIPSHVRQIRFPSLFLKWLWPFHTHDPVRGQPDSEFYNGRYPIGDKLILKLLTEGIPASEVAQRYLETNIKKMVNLDRLQQIASAELRHNDAQSDIHVSSLIFDTYQHCQTFSILNHPNPIILQTVLLEMLRIILDRMGLAQLSVPVETRDLISEQEIPIHPKVAEHFQLSWYHPNMKWRWGAERLTLSEYVTAYANNTPINFHERPQLWLDRACNAIRRLDFPEAERLYLKATATYPHIPDFLRNLGILHAQQGKLLEAEKVFRYLLTLHPKIAQLHSDLGNILFRRGFPEQAKTAFKEALKLDPNNQATLNNLRLAQRGCELKQLRIG